MDKVSVLVPIYNVEKYIERCVISLMEQTYENIEYIFVNDCTNDKSIEVLEKTIKNYPNRYNQVKIIHHKENKGLAAARNTGLYASSGEYIIHIDSDDWVSKDCVSSLMAKAIETHSDIVDGAYVDVYKDENKIVHSCNLDKETYIKFMLSGVGRCSNQIWGRLLRRKLYINYNINAIEGINYGEDYSVITRLLYYAKRTFVDNIIYYYNHLNENSYMKDLNNKNFKSLVSAKLLVQDFFYSRSDYNIYKDYIIIGLINCYKYGLKRNLDVEDLRKILSKADLTLFEVLYLKILNHNYNVLSKIMFYILLKSKRLI